MVNEAGYFDPAAITKPLLHLWSLGIEEQFYIVWPILLFTLWKLRALRNHRFALVLLLTIVLFSWNLLRVLLHTESIATFYLPQARFWELLVGASLAYASLFPIEYIKEFRTFIRSKIPNRFATHDVYSVAGALLIMLSILLLTKEHSFPGYWALLPTVGAALMIGAGVNGYLNRRLLSQPAAMFIGKISYPLYLWHWPLLSFAYIIIGDTPSLIVRLACVATSFLLAWLTYALVEKPLRFGRHLKYKAIILVLVMAIIGAIGYYIIYKNHGLESRDFAIRTKPLAEATSDWQYPSDMTLRDIAGVKTVEGIRIFTQGKPAPQILFFGDSHIEQYAPRAVKLSREKAMPIMFLTGGGCPAIPNAFAKLDPHCFKMIDNFHELLQNEPTIKTIVIGGFWNGYLLKFKQFHYLKDGMSTNLHTPDGKRLAIASLRQFIESLNKKYKVYLVLDGPDMPQVKPEYIPNRLTYHELNDLPRAISLPPAQLALNQELATMGREAGATVIDPLSHLCPHNICIRADLNGRPIYKDDDHLVASYVTEHATYLDEVFAAVK